MADPLVSADDLRAYCTKLLVALGVPEPDADLVAGTLVEADLRGVHSHGANLMSLYVNRIRAGHIKPVTEVTVVADNGSTALLDGGLGLGQIVGIRATDLSVERAKEHGLAAVSVRELTHLGALGFYTHRAAEQGVISLVVQNGPAFVPPYGGVTGLFSTNPFSYAFPAAEEEPVVFDIATTAVAGNRILLAKKRGDPEIPTGWASDSAGRPTTDTEAASIDHLQWFGGHKGYGIAFFVEVMAGVLANSSFGRTEHTGSPVHGKDRVAKGALFLAIDPARFPDGDAFGARIDTLVRDVWSSEPAEGFEQVSVPGDIERKLRERRISEGIPLSPASVAELDRIAGELGVESLKIDQ
jgi:LDH2 family malate/lactate/ureidoglycolate dehydrogenase